VLLQVADLFSYEAYKDALRRERSVEQPRLSMAALLELDSVGVKTRKLQEKRSLRSNGCVRKVSLQRIRLRMRQMIGSKSTKDSGRMPSKASAAKAG
jgi:hypothetical protein